MPKTHEPVLLHVGYIKTGTTFLQNVVFSGKFGFNALQLNVESRSNGDEAITVANLTVNGHSVPGTFGGDGLFSDFGITGFGTVSDFTVAGSIFRSGTALGTQRARPRVDLRMGNVEGNLRSGVSKEVDFRKAILFYILNVALDWLTCGPQS